MISRREILFAHYKKLFKKVTTWTGLFAMVGSALFMPMTANALQITDRSTTLGSSAVSVATTYTFTFKPATTGTVRAVKLETCTSPLEQTSCTAPADASMDDSSASLVTGSGTTAPFTTNWAEGTSGLASTDSTFHLVYATGDSLTAGNSYTIRLQNVENPSAVNTTFYTRITTYSDAAATTQVDYGAMAVSTARQISVSANVQESLTFCVGTSGTGCGGGGLTGTTVNLGTGADNVLSSSTPSGGISLMAVDTNATSGYAITYITTSPGGTGGSTCPGSLSSTNDCITDAGGSAGGFSAGTSKFGINLVDNATPNIGANVSGSGSGTASAPYATADAFAFQGGTTPRTVATASGPTVSNLFTVAYAAQAGNTTKPGAYSATFTWVATGTF